ncbi:MAG TPA: AbrB/MazE/SpoVT family DNA-binding domain-containing protein [bacterium]|jgi:antitoxin PrlF|nr:AbrB/MazE/SpoVT family DNA-binding domain-containing protein [bacterium]
MRLVFFVFPGWVMAAKMSGVISSRGRVTIPKSIRDALGLKPGDSVAFVAKDGAAILRPAKAWTLDELCGSLSAYAGCGPDIRHGHRRALGKSLRARKEKWLEG